MQHSGLLTVGIKLRLDLIQVQSLLRYSCNCVVCAHRRGISLLQYLSLNRTINGYQRIAGTTAEMLEDNLQKVSNGRRIPSRAVTNSRSCFICVLSQCTCLVFQEEEKSSQIEKQRLAKIATMGIKMIHELSGNLLRKVDFLYSDRLVVFLFLAFT